MGRTSIKPIGFVIAAAALAVVGFIGVRAFQKQTPSGPPITIELSEVSPLLLDGEDAQLVLSGLKLSVKLAATKEGDLVTLNSEAFGEALETEVYRITGRKLELAEANSETYDPPVLLLQSEMSEGETWEWDGKISSGGAPPYSARAELNVSLDKLNLPGVEDNAVYVRMTLLIDGVGPKPAKRELGFWFVRSKGLIKRDFGGVSSRMPRTLEVEEPIPLRNADAPGEPGGL